MADYTLMADSETLHHLNSIRTTCEYLKSEGVMGKEEIAELYSSLGFPVKPNPSTETLENS